MDFSGLGRAVGAWRDRRTVQKYSEAAHVMSHAAHTDELLQHLSSGGYHMAAADIARNAAKSLGKTSGKTAKRIDELAANPALKSKVDESLGLKSSNESSSPWSF